MVRLVRVELTTLRLGGECSIQLSYNRIFYIITNHVLAGNKKQPVVTTQQAACIYGL